MHRADGGKNEADAAGRVFTMKLVTIILIIIILSLTALLTGCSQEAENALKTEGQAAETAENVTADVGELASNLDEIDQLLR